MLAQTLWHHFVSSKPFGGGEVSFWSSGEFLVGG